MKNLLVVLSVSILPFISAAAIQAGEVYLPIKEHTLANGLKVLLLERHHSPTVACQIAFKVGHNNERAGVTGAAHMLEHMMFKGTRTIGTRDYAAEVPLMKEIDQAANEMLDEKLKGPEADTTRIENLAKRLDELQKEQKKYAVGEELSNLYKKNGGSGLNAYTADDYTNYIIKLPSNKLELWCWLESDRIANPVFREFYAEKEVVHEERRMRMDTVPSGSMWELFFSTAYMAHPYTWPTIGWPSDIANYRRETMQEFFNLYYAPNNAVIVWVGDFESEAALEMIRRYFEPIPRQEPPPPVVTVEPPQKGERRAALEFDANPTLLMGWHTVKISDSDFPVLEVMQGVLADGRTSRLYQRLREKAQLVSDVWAYQTQNEFPGMFLVSADPIQGVSAESVEKILSEEIQRLAVEKVDDWELQRVKNQLKSSFVTDLESNYVLARQLAEFECLAKWDLYLDSDKLRQAVTAEDIQRVAQKYLTDSNRTVVNLKPTSSPAKTPGT